MSLPEKSVMDPDTHPSLHRPWESARAPTLVCDLGPGTPPWPRPGLTFNTWPTVDITTEIYEQITHECGIFRCDIVKLCFISNSGYVFSATRYAVNICRAMYVFWFQTMLIWLYFNACVHKATLYKPVGITVDFVSCRYLWYMQSLCNDHELCMLYVN